MRENEAEKKPCNFRFDNSNTSFCPDRELPLCKINADEDPERIGLNSVRKVRGMKIFWGPVQNQNRRTWLLKNVTSSKGLRLDATAKTTAGRGNKLSGAYNRISIWKSAGADNSRFDQCATWKLNRPLTSDNLSYLGLKERRGGARYVNTLRTSGNQKWSERDQRKIADCNWVIKRCITCNCKLHRKKSCNFCNNSLIAKRLPLLDRQSMTSKNYISLETPQNFVWIFKVVL